MLNGNYPSYCGWVASSQLKALRVKTEVSTGLQGRNRDTDVENQRMDTKGGKWQGGGGVGGMN